MTFKTVVWSVARFVGLRDTSHVCHDTPHLSYKAWRQYFDLVAFNQSINQSINIYCHHEVQS